MRKEVLEKLLKDPVWAIKLEKAKTVREAGEVVAAYCRLKGFTVKETRL